MSLYLLTLLRRPTGVSGECATTFVVRAKSSHKARRLVASLAHSHSRSSLLEGASAWLDPRLTRCQQLNPNTKHAVLCRETALLTPSPGPKEPKHGHDQEAVRL